MTSWKNSFRLGALALALAATSAHADIIFTLGNVGSLDDENILFQEPGTIDGPALTVTGMTADSDLTVFFTGEENLTAQQASGQAVLQAQDGLFTTVTFGVQNGTAGSFIFNPNIFNTGGGQPETGFITVSVDQVVGPDVIFQYAASSAGNNFLTVEAINGQRIVDITITSDTPLSFVDVRQFRVGTATECPPNSTDPLCTGIPGGQIPEPGVLSLMGLALAAFGQVGMRRRRR